MYVRDINPNWPDYGKTGTVISVDIHSSEVKWKTEDGDITVTINNDGELESAYAECYGDEEGY